MPSKKLPHRIFSQNKPRPNWTLRIVVLLALGAGGYAAYRYLAPVAAPMLASAPAPVQEAAPAAQAAAPAQSAPPATVVAQAGELFAKGDLAGARGLLQPILAGSDAGLLPAALAAAAEIELAEGKHTEALALLERARREFSGSPEAPRTEGLYALALDAAGRAAEAEPTFAKLRDTAPKGLRAAGYIGLARKSERGGDLVAARDQFRQAVQDAAPGSFLWEHALDHLGRLNVQIIFSLSETPESKFYTVEKGDNLLAIGVKLNTTQGLLTRANGMTDSARLNLGQRLKYTPKDFRIIVERATCKIYLLDNDGIFKRYRTGLGMPGHETALGNYTIGNKQIDPVWHPQGRPPVAAGDPNNELGTRWMPLVPVEPNLPSDLGIHGTIAPETIGQYKSHGCPRMLKDDVEELYDLVVRSTPVQIVETISWEEALRPPVPATGTVAAGAIPGAPTGTPQQ